MTQDNVDLVRRMFELYSSGDLDEWVACWNEDAEWTSSVFEPLEGAPRTYRGHDGLRRFQSDVLEALAGMSVRGDEFREEGEAVLVLGHVSGRGAASGAAFDQPMTWLFEVRGGKLLRGRDYLDRDTALGDAARLQK